MKFFVVDDDPIYIELIRGSLESMGFKNVEVFLTGEECIMNLYKMPDIILLDYHLGDVNGMEVMKSIVGFNPDIQVIFLSSQKSIEIAVDALKYGAYDYVSKDENTFDRIYFLIQKAATVKEHILQEAKKKTVLRWGMLTAVLICMATIAFLTIHKS